MLVRVSQAILQLTALNIREHFSYTLDAGYKIERWIFHKSQRFLFHFSRFHFYIICFILFHSIWIHTYAARLGILDRHIGFLSYWGYLFSLLLLLCCIFSHLGINIFCVWFFSVLFFLLGFRSTTYCSEWTLCGLNLCLSLLALNLISFFHWALSVKFWKGILETNWLTQEA